jgi:AraC-like DNA-binding protein
VDDERSSGFAGQQMAKLTAAELSAAARQWPALNRLAATAAGYFPKAAGHVRRRPQGAEAAVLIHCVRGGGWCELRGALHPVRAGDLVALPPSVPHAYGTHQAHPWTIQWVHAQGEAAPDYLRALGADVAHPVVFLGDNAAARSLFHQVLDDLRNAPAPWNAFHAAHSLGHLLSVIIRHRAQLPAGAVGGAGDAAAPGVSKVAQAIAHMSEHLDRRLGVGALAALAGVSTAHFTALFKRQTGCSPRAYIQLLRMHQAAQWLAQTELSVKEIAARLGYQDPLHFSKQFKAFRGMSPTDFRAGPPWWGERTREP